MGAARARLFLLAVIALGAAADLAIGPAMLPAYAFRYDGTFYAASSDARLSPRAGPAGAGSSPDACSRALLASFDAAIALHRNGTCALYGPSNATLPPWEFRPAAQRSSAVAGWSLITKFGALAAAPGARVPTVAIDVERIPAGTCRPNGYRGCYRLPWSPAAPGAWRVLDASAGFDACRAFGQARKARFLLLARSAPDSSTFACGAVESYEAAYAITSAPVDDALCPDQILAPANGTALVGDGASTAAAYDLRAPVSPCGTCLGSAAPVPAGCWRYPAARGVFYRSRGAGSSPPADVRVGAGSCLGGVACPSDGTPYECDWGLGCRAFADAALWRPGDGLTVANAQNDTYLEFEVDARGEPVYSAVKCYARSAAGVGRAEACRSHLDLRTPAVCDPSGGCLVFGARPAPLDFGFRGASPLGGVYTYDGSVRPAAAAPAFHWDASGAYVLRNITSCGRSTPVADYARCSRGGGAPDVCSSDGVHISRCGSRGGCARVSWTEIVGTDCSVATLTANAAAATAAAKAAVQRAQTSIDAALSVANVVQVSAAACAFYIGTVAFVMAIRLNLAG